MSRFYRLQQRFSECCSPPPEDVFVASLAIGLYVGAAYGIYRLLFDRPQEEL